MSFDVNLWKDIIGPESRVLLLGSSRGSGDRLLSLRAEVLFRAGALVVNLRALLDLHVRVVVTLRSFVGWRSCYGRELDRRLWNSWP